MNQAFHLVTLPLFLTSSYQGINGQEMTLIQNKEVSATIVLPDSPSRIETQTRRLFCRYLAMIARQPFIPSTIRESEFTASSGQSVVLIGNAESNQLIQRMAKKGFFKLSQDHLGSVIIVQVKVFYSSTTIGEVTLGIGKTKGLKQLEISTQQHTSSRS
ncbi:MAG: hypothetical protein VX289_01015 [Candidatus Poribacteria bacterium]|nr:hypothetical protein [Candidatus Poribacteria bacterium]